MNWDDQRAITDLMIQLTSLNKMRLYWKVKGEKKKEQEVKKLIKKNFENNAMFFRMFVSFAESKRAEKMFEYLDAEMEDDKTK